jgi:hypothetical protein
MGQESRRAGLKKTMNTMRLPRLPDKVYTELVVTAAWWAMQPEPSEDEHGGWPFFVYHFYKANFPLYFEKEEEVVKET